MNYQELYEHERDLREAESRAENDRMIEKMKQERRNREERMCFAEDWNDAWWKAEARLRKEAGEEAADTHYADTFFQDELAVTEKAHALYEQHMMEVEPQIRQIREEAERQIAELEQNVRNTVADAIATLGGIAGESIIQALRDDNPQSLVNW